jgi:Fe/S biogenesis protein NfuA
MSIFVDVAIKITENGLAHFNKLIANEETPGTGLRMFLDQPGSPQAEVGIAFCPPGEQRATDIPLAFEGFTLYVDRASAAFLHEANIDYQLDKVGGQLAISAPHLKGKKPDDAANLAERLQYLIDTEINPQLASHKGMVSLIEITEDLSVVLKFGGGCHGCGMVDVTLKHGIEKTLKERFPEIKAVKDATDHATGDAPYC